MSCSSAPIASARSRPGGTPRRSPSWTASSATRRVCCSVDASFSARRTMSARTCGPSSASSAATSSAAARSPVAGATARRGAGRARPGCRSRASRSVSEGVAAPPADAPRLTEHLRGARARATDAGTPTGRRRGASARTCASRAARVSANRPIVNDERPERRPGRPPSGWLGDDRGSAKPSAPRKRIQTTVTTCSRRSRPRPSLAAQARVRREAEDCRADRQRRPAGKREQAVVLLVEEDLGRRERMDQQQGRHRGEGGADRDRADVAAARARARQQDGRDAGDEHRRADRDHVRHVEVVGLVRAEDDEQRERAPRGRRRAGQLDRHWTAADLAIGAFAKMIGRPAVRLDRRLTLRGRDPSEWKVTLPTAY